MWYGRFSAVARRQIDVADDKNILHFVYLYPRLPRYHLIYLTLYLVVLKRKVEHFESHMHVFVIYKPI